MKQDNVGKQDERTINFRSVIFLLHQLWTWLLKGQKALYIVFIFAIYLFTWLSISIFMPICLYICLWRTPLTVAFCQTWSIPMKCSGSVQALYFLNFLSTAIGKLFDPIPSLLKMAPKRTDEHVNSSLISPSTKPDM